MEQKALDIARPPRSWKVGFRIGIDRFQSDGLKYEVAVSPEADVCEPVINVCQSGVEQT